MGEKQLSRWILVKLGALKSVVASLRRGRGFTGSRTPVDPISDEFERSLTSAFEGAVAEQRENHRAAGVPFYTVADGLIVDSNKLDPGAARVSRPSDRKIRRVVG